MDVRELVESAFKELLRDKRYGKITVSEICRMAGVTRKAFYSVFRDKEAGRFQAVNAPYATFARSREKASAGFCQPSVCRGLPFN